MRIGASLFLIALGAILKFAVTTHVSGVNLSTVGVVLMIVGLVGLLITVVVMMSRRRTDVVHEGVYGERRTTYLEPGPRVDPPL